MPLSNMTCQAAKPKQKPYKLSDGEGLYLEVMPTGSKYWRLKYRLNRKEKRISLGVYPKVSLQEVRKLKDNVRTDLRRGVDPVINKLQQAQTASYTSELTFKAMAMEWYEKQVPEWKPSYALIVKHRFEKYLFPFIGNYPLPEIKPLVMLSCLQRIEKSAPDLSRRMKAICSHVYKYAIATGRAENDPTYGLESAMKRFKKGHYAAISVDEFPEFLKNMYAFAPRLERQTFLALQLLLLTFVRTSELVEAEWDEINFEKAMWTIPGERMKMNLPHLVPLSRQSISIFEELKKMNGKRKYVFPGYINPLKPMSKNTMLMALKRMGYKNRMTGHGFRSLALGILKEKLGYPHEIADRQLAHVPKSSVDRAYDRAEFLPHRKEMMQRYADYIDTLFSYNTVFVNLHFGNTPAMCKLL